MSKRKTTRRQQQHHDGPKKLKPPKIERWLLLPDIHCSVDGAHDANALATVSDFMKSQRWDGLLHLGDLISFDIISSHNTGNLRAVEGGRLLEEF